MKANRARRLVYEIVALLCMIYFAVRGSGSAMEHIISCQGPSLLLVLISPSLAVSHPPPPPPPSVPGSRGVVKRVQALYREAFFDFQVSIYQFNSGPESALHPRAGCVPSWKTSP